MRCSQKKRKSDKHYPDIHVNLRTYKHKQFFCVQIKIIWNVENLVLWRFWQIQFHKFVQYWFTSVWEIPVMASFSWFSSLSARQPLPTFLSPWLVMLDLKIIFFFDMSQIFVSSLRFEQMLLLRLQTVIRKLKYIKIQSSFHKVLILKEKSDRSHFGASFCHKSLPLSSTSSCGSE